MKKDFQGILYQPYPIIYISLFTLFCAPKVLNVVKLTVIIILSIFSLWPVVLDWYHPLFEAVMYIALAGLVWIFYRRIKRFNEARRKT